ADCSRRPMRFLTSEVGSPLSSPYLGLRLPRSDIVYSPHYGQEAHAPKFLLRLRRRASNTDHIWTYRHTKMMSTKAKDVRYDGSVVRKKAMLVVLEFENSPVQTE